MSDQENAALQAGCSECWGELRAIDEQIDGLSLRELMAERERLAPRIAKRWPALVPLMGKAKALESLTVGDWFSAGLRGDREAFCGFMRWRAVLKRLADLGAEERERDSSQPARW